MAPEPKSSRSTWRPDRDHLLAGLIALVAVALVPIAYVGWALAFTVFPTSNTSLILALAVFTPATLAFLAARRLSLGRGGKWLFVAVLAAGVLVVQATRLAFSV